MAAGLQKPKFYHPLTQILLIQLIRKDSHQIIDLREMADQSQHKRHKQINPKPGDHQNCEDEKGVVPSFELERLKEEIFQ